ncbi:hypothetical protein BC831DRAFT_514396 [Entophlyctis helioformis]|nr:hypothetical protein BC831DRAFT_514396 [Entophlyctis helioformis]
MLAAQEPQLQPPPPAYGSSAPSISNTACLSFPLTDSVRIVYGPPETVLLVRQAIRASWPAGIRLERTLVDKFASQARSLSDAYGLVSHKFELNGIPWQTAFSVDAAARARLVFLSILHTMATNGWRVVASTMLGKTVDRCDNLFFVRDVPNPSPMVAVGLRPVDTLLVVGWQTANDRAVQAIRETLAAHWPRGLQADKVMGPAAHRFRLRGRPWLLDKEDAVEARLLVKAMIEKVALLGYDLVCCNMVEPWTFNPRAPVFLHCDTLFFQKRSPAAQDAVQDASAAMLDELPLYETVASPPAYGGMAGISSRQRDHLDLSNLACMALESTESIVLLSDPAGVMPSAVQDAVALAWPRGIQGFSEQPGSSQGTSITVPEIKLKGSPFGSAGDDAVLGKRFILTLLSQMALRGWRLAESLDIKATDDLSMLVFAPSAPATRAVHFAVAFSVQNKVRLIGCNSTDPCSLSPAESTQVAGIITDALNEITAKPTQDVFAGAIEWTAAVKGLDLYIDKAEAMRRVRLFVGLVMVRLEAAGWSLVGTPSLNKKTLQSDVLVFARFE